MNGYTKKLTITVPGRENADGTTTPAVNFHCDVEERNDGKKRIMKAQTKEELINRYRHLGRLLADEFQPECDARSLRVERDAVLESITRIERIEALTERLDAVLAAKAPGWSDGAKELRRQIKAVSKLNC